MQTLDLNIGAPINTSLQVGDAAYYTKTSLVVGSGFDTANTVVFFGVVTAINHALQQVSVLYDNAGPDGILNNGDEITIPSDGDYIMFGKNKSVNSSDVKGYYANVKFKNESKGKVELFSIGSEVSESSK